jgi:prepilin-type N-terminal cleavage/methylation domain-containing protein
MVQTKRSKGFTLIELMIVVAIIGILAAVAIPKFADLVTKSKEASVKGGLGAVRSAVSIYYGDLEGSYPGNLFEALAWANRYMPAVGGASSLGTIDIPKHSNAGGNPGHGYGSVQSNEVATTNSDATAFWYTSATGDTYINCSHDDTKGSRWTGY